MSESNPANLTHGSLLLVHQLHTQALFTGLTLSLRERGFTGPWPSPFTRLSPHPDSKLQRVFAKTIVWRRYDGFSRLAGLAHLYLPTEGSGLPQAWDAVHFYRRGSSPRFVYAGSQTVRSLVGTRVPRLNIARVLPAAKAALANLNALSPENAAKSPLSFTP